MFQLADSEEQDLLVGGAGYSAFEAHATESQGTEFWQSPVLLFVCVALAVLALAAQ